MLSNAVLAALRKFTWLRRPLWRGFFGGLARLTRHADWWTCMNYGYAADDAAPDPIAVPAADQAERYCLQLYHHVATSVATAGTDILEVSCGRGGGAAYMSRYLGPRSVTAIDISANAIAFCRRVHKAPALHFLRGDAERIPMRNRSVDIVVNIEASFCYGDIDRFLSEVFRVLRPGGHFLYADLRLAEEIDELTAALARCDLTLVGTTDISANVVRALECDSDRRRDAADRHVPLPFRRLIKTFGGAEGTRIPEFLKTKRMRYLNFVLRKPPPPQQPWSAESAAAPVDRQPTAPADRLTPMVEA